MRLHLDRVRWLTQKIPPELSEKQEVKSYLERIGNVAWFDAQVPASIKEYLNNAELQARGKNDDPDSLFEAALYRTIFQQALVGARKKSPSDSAWADLRVLLCGGGGRCKFYSDYITKLDQYQNKFGLAREALEVPDGLVAPGLATRDYDRISVAYGLAQGPQWEYEWPEMIDDLQVETNSMGVGDFVSKDMV